MPTCAVGKSAGFDGTIRVAGQIVGKARDAELSASNGIIDATTRDSGGNREVLAGIMEYSVTIAQLWVFSNAARQAIEAAFLAKSIIAWELLDKDGNGYSGEGIISDLNFGQPFNDVLAQDVTIQGCGAIVPVSATS